MWSRTYVSQQENWRLAVHITTIKLKSAVLLLLFQRTMASPYRQKLYYATDVFLPLKKKNQIKFVVFLNFVTKICFLIQKQKVKLMPFNVYIVLTWRRHYYCLILTRICLEKCPQTCRTKSNISKTIWDHHKYHLDFFFRRLKYVSCIKHFFSTVWCC